MGKKLYEIIHDLELKVARIEPSQYLMMLPPQEAVADLRIHIERLNEEFQRHEQAFIRDELDTQEALEGIRRLILEIELVKHCIACFLDRGDFRPWDSKKGGKFRSAA
jgi:lysyl-tRNA synthetase class I